MPDYQKLQTKVKMSIDQKLEFRNFDARHGRIETGAVVKSRMGLSGFKYKRGFWYQWKEKGECSKGEQCSFWHESFLIVRQNQITKPPHLLSHPCHEVEVCLRKKHPRQK